MKEILLMACFVLAAWAAAFLLAFRKVYSQGSPQDENIQKKGDQIMKTKYKKQRIFTSIGSNRKPMKSRHRMIWKDENGFFYCRTQHVSNGQAWGYWFPVRQVTSDIWLIDNSGAIKPID